MALMAPVDEALWANEGIIASFADIHNGIFWMPIASSLKVTIKSMGHHLFLLSDNALTIKHILLPFWEYMMRPHELHELFVKSVIYLSDFLAFTAGDAIIHSLFLSVNFVKCTK